MCRSYAVPNSTQNPYRDGGRFKVVTGKKFFKLLKKVSLDRGVRFTKFNCGDNEYRMDHADIWFVSDVHMYKLDDEGLSGAVTRLTCARKPTEKGVHERLRRNQFKNVGVWPEFDLWKEFWLRSYKEKHHGLDLVQDSREEWVHAPHPKKKLRVSTNNKLADLLYYSHKTWIFDDDLALTEGNVKYKMKPGELLPREKYLRAVGDMTAPGAALGGYCMDKVKEAFADNFELYGGYCTFVKKPELHKLVEAFDRTINTKRVEFTYFSDDSMIGINCDDGQFFANLDISACDGSNFDPVFNLLRGVMEKVVDKSVVNGVFEQCYASCCIRNVWEFKNKCKEYFVLKPKYATLYSGSVLTTAINNVANTCIFVAFMRNFNKLLLPLKKDMPALLEYSAAEVGFLIKCQTCVRIEQLQFLKTSPTIVGGEVRVFLNLAVRMRGYGSCKGDFPGSSLVPLEVRAKEYFNGVIKSFCHDGEHCVTKAFRSRMKGKAFEQKLEDWDIKILADFEFVIPEDSLISRYTTDFYKPSLLDFEELSDFIISGKPGEGFNSPLVQNIFFVDYGYPIVNNDRELVPINF